MKPLLRVLAVLLLGVAGFRLELPGPADRWPAWLAPPELSGHGPRLERAAARARLEQAHGPEERAWGMLLVARSYCSERRYERCVEGAREARAVAASGAALELEAGALSDGGAPREAAALLRRALAAERAGDPALEARLRLVLGKALLRSAEPGEALAVYERVGALGAAPREARFEAGLRAAQALRALGRFDEARVVQERALAMPVAGAPRRALLAEIGILDDLEGRP